MLSDRSHAFLFTRRRGSEATPKKKRGVTARACDFDSNFLSGRWKKQNETGPSASGAEVEMSFKRLCSAAYSRAESVFRWPDRLRFLRGYFAIAGGCIVHLTLGTVYTFGNLAPYIVSYIRQRSHPAELQPGTAAWIYALALGGQGFSMFFGGLMEKRIGPRLSTLIGCGIMSLGVLLTYVAVQVSFWLVLFTYGVLFGLGVGIAYVGPLACAMRWMPRWKGVMAGLVLAGFGLGALVFTPVQTVFINPRNRRAEDGIFQDADVLDRVPSVFLLLGGIYIVLQIVGSLLIVNPPEPDTEEVLTPQESNDEQESIASRAEKFFSRRNSDSSAGDSRENFPASQNLDYSPEPESGSPSGDERETNEESRLVPTDLNLQQDVDKKKGKRKRRRFSPQQENMRVFSKSKEPDLESSIGSTASLRSSTSSQNVTFDSKPLQMLKKLNFYFLWIMMLMAGFAVVFTATLYKFFGLSFINDDHFLAIVGSAASICNCAGRIVWGLIADKVSYKFSLVLQSGIMSIFLLTFYATSAVGKSTYFIWVCVIFFCIGGVFSVFPTAIARSFGSKYMSVNYGLLFTSQIFSGVVAALLFTTVQHVLGWMGMIFLVSGVCLIGFVFTLLFQPKRYVILDLGGI